VGKTCGNGGRDNCFYPYPLYCVGSGCVTYSGSLSKTGQCAYSPYFYSSVTGYYKGHLEGPEGSYNLVDFDLYLLKWINNKWQTVASSIRYGSVDDINYYGTVGYYAWGVCSYSGSGSLMLYTSRPQ
jgi:streptogrisin C